MEPDGRIAASPTARGSPVLASKFYLHTLKEAPAEAEVASQRLMLRAGMVKKVAAGIYSWLPLGLITLRKVERIVRDEMNRAGALETYLPHVVPAELWQETGRWDKFGPQLLKIRDRQQRDFLFGPTHEEVVTDVVRRDVSSYRQLPLNLYQIQVKFRDEIRPRFGVMRGREFLMKDAYSFDTDRDALMASYRTMYAAYERIFSRLGLRFRAVEADTGAIGGFASHEFQVLAESGEDAIAWSDGSGFAANVEQAEALAPASPRAAPAESMEKVATPGRSTCEEVAELLGLPLTRTVKCLLVFVEERVQMLLVRGDHMGNEVKIGKLPGFGSWRWATEAEIVAATGCRPGYLGPVGIPRDMPLVADRTVAAMSDFVCGANEAGYHLRGVNFGRDCREPDAVADLRNVVAGDPSPDGKGTLAIVRGIEVGHVFALGDVYSKAMNATYLDATGAARHFQMGCYGIGVTRVVAAAIEQNHDERGIAWPAPMAPFAVAIAPIGYDRSEAVRRQADLLHGALEQAGIEVLLDDRGERPGVMFADLELIGIPLRVTVGERGLKEGIVECQARRGGEAEKLPAADAALRLIERIGHP
ncbi:MAG: proline--tRNA ligase [Proteobacteria bacterium]|nr:proline--tRNA ligase [Pseudomonadota bacterium]